MQFKTNKNGKIGVCYSLHPQINLQNIGYKLFQMNNTLLNRSNIQNMHWVQCCESRSGSARIRIHFGELDPDPDLHWEYRSGSGSRRAKITQKSEENSSFEVPDVLF
jgi:hypothetical protein